MPEQKLNSHVFIFNKQDNGGEQLFIETEYFDNGDVKPGWPEGIFTNQKITLMSYDNSASFNLCGIALTPENLRKLADELEQAEKEAYRIALKK